VAQPPASKEPPQFPWSEHRKLKNQLERYERDLNDRQERLKALETERISWQQNQQALSQKAKDFDALATVLQRNPALADEIERAIHGEPTTARGAAAVAQLPPEFLKQWNEMRQQLGVVTKGWQEQETLRRQAFEQQEMQKTGMELKTRLTGLLKEHNYAESLYPQVEAYLLQRVRELGGADLEDVPYLFNEWYKAQEDAFNARLDAFRKGATTSAAAPASPGGGGQLPITAKPDFGALDRKTNEAAEKALRERLGWGNGA